MNHAPMSWTLKVNFKFVTDFYEDHHPLST